MAPKDWQAGTAQRPQFNSHRLSYKEGIPRATPTRSLASICICIRDRVLKADDRYPVLRLRYMCGYRCHSRRSLNSPIVSPRKYPKLQSFFWSRLLTWADPSPLQSRTGRGSECLWSGHSQACRLSGARQLLCSVTYKQRFWGPTAVPVPPLTSHVLSSLLTTTWGSCALQGSSCMPCHWHDSFNSVRPPYP